MFAHLLFCTPIYWPLLRVRFLIIRVKSHICAVLLCQLMCVPVKVLVCLCLLSYVCAYVLVCVSEPAPWISGVGHSRDEQSRIKSILILARQEPLLLLGDMSTEREKGKENKPSSSFFYSCHLLSLTVFAPSSSHCFFFFFFSFLLFFFFFSSLHLCLFPFLLSFFHCPVLCCPPSPPPLDSSCSSFLSSLSLGLCTEARSCWHRGMADSPLWSSRQFRDFRGFQEVH